MKKFIKFIVVIFVILILVIAVSVFYLTRGLESGKNLTISKINLSQVNDGTYDGKYNAGRWTNEVNVIVKDHKIININVVKDVRFPIKEVTKELINKIIDRQNIDVDAISGSTVTSKAYLKSIENALKK